MSPDPRESAQACFQQGRTARRDGDASAATALFRRAIALDPTYIPPYNNLATLLQGLGESAAAVALLEQALQLGPDKPVLHCNLASARQMRGELALARVGFEAAIGLDPGFFLAHFNLGKLLATEEAWAEAASAYTKALQLKPDAGEVHLELGHLYRQRDRFDEALDCYKAATRLMPDSAAALNTLGALLQQRGESKFSRHCYQRALKLAPDFALAHANLAMLCENAGELETAIAHYTRAVALQPDMLNAHYNLNYLRLKLADWEDLDARIASLARLTAAHLAEGRTVSLPLFSLLSLPLPAELLLAVTRNIADGHASAARAMRMDFPAQTVALDPSPPRLRVGYVSPDFRRHAVGRLIHEMFQHHRRPDFEIFAYSLCPVEDRFTTAIRAGCDHYLDASELSVPALAKRIRDDGIHILVDLAGYTSNARTTLFALKPAPVQVQFLGYPGTMGADFIPYVLADQTLIPPAARQGYTEEVLYLDHAWVSSPMLIRDTTPSRHDFGLPETGVVYCCFNGIYKIEPRVFGCWMRILGQVPGSVLWLADGGRALVRERMRERAAAHGVDPNRLVFAGHNLPHADYLARYRVADLFLDTFTYNAGSTAAGTLWAGLPLLSCPGQTYPSRMGASLSHAGGFTDTLCASEADYEARAVSLGQEPAQLADLKSRLASAVRDAPLFKPERFVSNLETTLAALWHRVATKA